MTTSDPRPESAVEHARRHPDPAQQVPEPGGEQRAGGVVDDHRPALLDAQAGELVGDLLRLRVRVVEGRALVAELRRDIDVLRAWDVRRDPLVSQDVLAVVAVEGRRVQPDARVEHRRRVRFEQAVGQLRGGDEWLGSRSSGHGSTFAGSMSVRHRVTSVSGVAKIARSARNPGASATM